MSCATKMAAVFGIAASAPNPFEMVADAFGQTSGPSRSYVLAKARKKSKRKRDAQKAARRRNRK